MATVTLTVGTTSDAAALELYSGGYTAATATDGFKFLNDGKTLFFLKNADTGATTATVDCPQPCSYGGTTVHDQTYSCTNAKDYVMGPFEKSQWNDSDGYVTISVTEDSDVTDISAKAVSLTY